MTELEKWVSMLTEAALHPRKTVMAEMKETGKEAIGCFPIHTPAEIIYAAGYLPVGMWGGKVNIRMADRYLPGFCCSIMRSNVEFGIRGTYDMLKAVIIPTFCDTLKCVCENWKVAVPQIPVIPMVYPQNRTLEVGITYLNQEFRRVMGEIEALSGVRVTEKALCEAFEIYENSRRLLRSFTETACAYPITINAKTRHLLLKAGYFMDRKKYNEIMQKIVEGLAKMPPEDFQGHKVIVTGLIGEPVEVMEILDENGICVAGDDFAQESRQFRTSSRAAGSTMEKMAWRIADQRGDTFLYEEEKTKGSMLIQMAKEKKADGIVVCMMKFCDPEEFDYPIIKAEIEKAGIPLLYIEIEQQMDSFEQIRTRIQSFGEMLG